jgi:hypothetical protein
MFLELWTIRLRSKDYGSPQHRGRLYVLGMREDTASPRDMDEAVHMFADVFPGVHQRASLQDVQQFTSSLDQPRILPPLSKDRVPICLVCLVDFSFCLEIVIWEAPRTVQNGSERFWGSCFCLETLCRMESPQARKRRCTAGSCARFWFKVQLLETFLHVRGPRHNIELKPHFKPLGPSKSDCIEHFNKTNFLDPRDSGIPRRHRSELQFFRVFTSFAAAGGRRSRLNHGRCSRHQKQKSLHYNYG